MHSIVDGIEKVGLIFVLSTASHLVALICDGLACGYAAGDAGTGIPRWHFIRACIAAHAINNATPGNALGEVSRYSLLRQRLEPDRALATVALVLTYI
jgi:uncharacterized membrane protein YbhN (UPF0104 family)